MNKPRILIVEDEAVVAQDIQQQLAALGYEPLGVTPIGEEALALTGQLRPNLVLADIRLAGEMDGIELAQVIHDRFAIPVVFLTAFAADETLDRAKLTEPFGYIIKPFEDRELRTVIEMALYKHQAESRLRHSYEEQAAILQSAMDGFWLVDMQGRILEVNEACCRMTGYTREELLRRSLSDLDADESPDEIAANIEKVAHAGCVRLERRHRRKDGRLIHVEVSSNYLPASGGRFFCFLRDVTEWKRTVENLRESEERYRTLFQSSVDAIMTLEPPLWRFTSGNPATVRLFGMRDEQEFISKEPWALSPERQPDGHGSNDKAREMIEIALRDGFHFFEWTHRRINGEDFPATVLLTRTEQAGKRFLQATVRDVTDRKRAEVEKAKLEAQFQQAQKMESVGRLAGGVAHDFNNMLGVILGNVEMAMSQVDPAQPLFADLEEIRKAARRSADLTRQLLTFARRQTIAPKVLDLNETVESLLKLLRRLIGEDIHLAWLPAAHLGPVKMDPTQIDQILANLCVNARDAIGGVGKVTIETENAVFDDAYCADHPGFVPGEFVRLAVSDDGCGMDKETLAHIFEPFFTTKSAAEGTGLGLATVYGIVKQNHGFIRVYSEPGQGTTLTIFLPRHADQAAAARTECARELPVSRGETILLVEDEASILAIARRVLERLGYTVLTASTPGEAIRLVGAYAGEIHLLMTDVVMPEMNGRDLTNRLLSLRPKLKSLFMSGYTADVIAHHGVMDEAVHFIQKPFSMEDLATKVRKALEGP